MNKTTYPVEDGKVMKKANKFSYGVVAFIVAIVVIVIIALVSIQLGVNLANDANKANVVTITNQFVDLNGDGKTDYIKSAEVIINNGQVDFTQAQP